MFKKTKKAPAVTTVPKTPVTPAAPVVAESAKQELDSLIKSLPRGSKCAICDNLSANRDAVLCSECGVEFARAGWGLPPEDVYKAQLKFLKANMR